MPEVALISAEPVTPPRRRSSRRTSRKKLLVGSVVPVLAWTAWAGHAWAQGCCCG